MLNRKLTAISLIAATTIGIVGCSEEDTQNPNASDSTESTTMATESESPEITNKPSDVTDKPADVNSRINMELLSELGMTFGELEEKYGEATRGRMEETYGDVDYVIYSYFFEKDGIGLGNYTFKGGFEDVQKSTLPDGTPKLSDDLQLRSFNGPVGSLFLRLEEPMTVEEFAETYGINLLAHPERFGDYYWAFFSYVPDGKLFNIGIDVKSENGLVELDSFMSLSDNPNGN